MIQPVFVFETGLSSQFQTSPHPTPSNLSRGAKQSFLVKNISKILRYGKKSWFYHSVLKLFTGFAIAAFIACKLTVNTAMNIAINPANAKIDQLVLIL